jgi:hypothetical protein
LLSLTIKLAISSLLAVLTFISAKQRPAKKNTAAAKFVNLNEMYKFGVSVVKKFNILVKIVICLGLALFLLTCAASKKIKTANILKKCEFTFQRASIDSFTGDSLKFSVFLNTNNKSEDSLYIQGLIGTLYLDSLFEVPFSLQDSKWLSIGRGQISFSGAIQLELFKLLALPNVKKFRMQGKAFVALKPGQEATDIDFNETRDIPPDLVEKMLRKLIGF